MSDSVTQCATEIADSLGSRSNIFRSSGRIRPLLGGVFGAGEFSIMSHAFTKAGLDCVWFSVVHTSSRYPLSMNHETQREAVEGARLALARCDKRLLLLVCGMAARILDQRDRERIAEARAAQDEERRQYENPRSKRGVPSIPRRRKTIFEKSGGKCFYCKCELDLTGTWHIEHMMPRALGGNSKPSNLVASCAPCNYKKNDKTADEFISGQRAEVQA